ncbi:MAG: prolipoprotein diacylglyceryl transferase [Phycisphaerae bacterium]
MLHSLAYYVHNLNPIIFHLGPIKPRWYGFAYLMGFLAAYLLIMKLARVGMLRVPPARVPDLVLNACIFGVLIGGRVGFILFYDLPISLHDGRTPLLWSFSSDFPFWGLLRVNEGGMSAHGGIIFTIITLIVFTWKYNKSLPKSPALIDNPASPASPPIPNHPRKLSIINIGDASCMVVPIGLFFGRIANFINGELYGHPSTVPWAVKFPSEIYAPTNGEMLPSVRDALPSVFHKLYGVTANWFDPATFDQYYNTLCQQLQAHNAAAVHAVAAILPPRHPSQLYEGLLEGVCLFIICWSIGWFWRKDGMASGAFLTFYPVMRIIGEQFRVGDTPAKILGHEISKGVLYSLIMIIPALAFWIYWIKKDRRVPWIPQEVGPTPTGGASAKSAA